jgi:uncharacterized membrane protein
MRRAVIRALDHWQREGLLTTRHAEELRASLDASQSDRAIRAFAVIGAVLAGLGALLFVGSNWSAMGPVARGAVLLGTYGAVVAGATVADRRGLPWVAEAAWLLTTLVLGANIFLLAQIFNHSLTYWPGPFLWMVGALALGRARRCAWQVALAVPLGLLALGWLGGGTGWFLDDQMEFLVSSGGLRPILPLLGVGLVSLSLLAGRTAGWRFASTPCFAWGLALATVPLVVSTAHVEAARAIFSIDLTMKQGFVIAVVVAVLGAALAWGRFDSREGRPLLAGATVLFALVLVQTSDRPWMAGDTATFMAYVAMVFALALTAVWVGARAQHTRLINVGLASSGLLIVIQYFGWSIALLDRSLVFVGGGLLLLGLSVALERKRRALLAAAPGN